MDNEDNEALEIPLKDLCSELPCLVDGADGTTFASGKLPSHASSTVSI